jgi:hypothetical protein
MLRYKDSKIISKYFEWLKLLSKKKKCINDELNFIKI